MSVTLGYHPVFTPASLVPEFSTCFAEIDTASEVKIVHTSPPLSHVVSQQTSQEPHPLIFGVRHDRMVPVVAEYTFDHHSLRVCLHFSPGSSPLPCFLLQLLLQNSAYIS